MISRLRPPGGDRTWYALMYFIGGLWFVSGWVRHAGFRWEVGVFGVISAIVAAGMWFRCRWADFGGVGVAAFMALYMIAILLGEPSLWNALLVFGCGWILWDMWKLCHNQGVESDEPTGEDGEKGESEPMISLVLFLKEPRYLECAVLANILESAWQTKFITSEGEKEGTQNYVVGESPMFIVGTREAMFLIHNHPRQYFDDTETVVEELREARMRKAVAEHQAWLSVDLLRPLDESRAPESFYPQIARLVAELAGPDCLGLFQPHTSRFNPWDESLAEKLRGAAPLSAVSEYSDAPVIAVKDDDPRMVAAVAEARQRWPEFVEAFRQRTEGQHFSIKAPITRGENTEFIWVKVFGLEPEYIHGHLGNNPVNLDGMKLGDQVEVPLKDLTDWVFIRDAKPVGLFTPKVIDQVQAERGTKGES
ncbi:MAG: DUF2314 domain-containing protein [Verrucomicrobiota bacterium]